ncbi:hypothetical protein BKA67DRAFT_578865 [Truncatella angustata]|uniref:Uncharacterized protein n=1 Tax=Truncatella angustata TaxID=152316 RepID=A0A9P8RKU5_9PEZI|nr:uncharacterized protein BKA67DRAFT_578865 [Truncatella angustata]KAH6647905.1 hypothetical protein BKA67DRAFT_578865 [Truncatella angustata]
MGRLQEYLMPDRPRCAPVRSDSKPRSAIPSNRFKLKDKRNQCDVTLPRARSEAVSGRQDCQEEAYTSSPSRVASRQT